MLHLSILVYISRMFLTPNNLSLSLSLLCPSFLHRFLPLSLFIYVSISISLSLSMYRSGVIQILFELPQGS